MDQPARGARNRGLHSGRRARIAFPGQLSGIYAATLTPFDRDHKPDADLAIPYYEKLLERGCEGLNILGTTGEAMSVAVHGRVKFMECVAAALPHERLMVGTGAAAFHDAVEVTQAAFSLGFRASLVMPPFYYRDVTDAGILHFFEELLKRVKAPAGSLFLYNFPRMSGITFHTELVDALLNEFPGAFGGMKDSSNDFTLERELHERYPQFAILPGSEELLPEVISENLAGCISGSVCLWAELASQAWRERDTKKAEQVRALRLKLGTPFIPAVRARVAAEEKNDAWLRSMPPL